MPYMLCIQASLGCSRNPQLAHAADLVLGKLTGCVHTIGICSAEKDWGYTRLWARIRNQL